MVRKPCEAMRDARDAILATGVGRLRYAAPRFTAIPAASLTKIAERALDALTAFIDDGRYEPISHWASTLAAWTMRQGVSAGETVVALDFLAELLRDKLYLSSIPPVQLDGLLGDMERGWRELRRTFLETAQVGGHRKLERFHRYTSRLTDAGSIKRIARLALDAARRLTGAKATALTLFSRNGSRTRIGALGGTPQEALQLRAVLQRHYRAQGAQPLAAKTSTVALAADEPTLSLPLMRRGRVLGDLVIVGKPGARGFTPEDAQWGGLLADYVAAAVSSAVVRDRYKKRAKEHRVLSEMSKLAGYAKNNEDLVRIMLDHLEKVIPNGVSALFLANGSRGELFLRGTRPLTPALEEQLRGQFLDAFRRTNRSDASLVRLTLTRLEPNGFQPDQPPIERLAPTSIVQTPLFVAPTKEFVGLLLMGDERENAFSEEQVRFLSSLASQASESIHRLRAVRTAERRRLEGIVERLQDGVLLLDDQRRVTLANATGRERLGMLGAANVGEVLTRLGEWNLGDLFEKAHRTPPVWEEVTVQTNGGCPRVLEIVPQIMGSPARPRAALLVLRDITLRHQAEARMRQAREFAEVLIDTAPAIVLVLNADGRVIHYNAFVEEITGCKLNDLKGADWFEAEVVEADRAGFRRAFQQILAGQRLRGHPAALKTCNDVGRDFSWWGSSLPAGPCGDKSVVVIGHDLTPLKAAQERAMQVERLAAIGQMVTGLGHESRNALQRSQASLERLARRLERQPEALELVDCIQKAQDHLLYLYEEVRDYAAPVRLRKAPCLLADLLRETWNHLAISRRNRDANLRQLGALHVSSCHVDPIAMQQVFRNILENSLAACGDPVVLEADWALTARDGQEWVRIILRDNGPGFSDEARMRLFEPFYTTKTRGTGLGMPIVKRIVDAHAGQISLGTANGSGAELVLSLPKGRA